VTHARCPLATSDKEMGKKGPAPPASTPNTQNSRAGAPGLSGPIVASNAAYPFMSIHPRNCNFLEAPSRGQKEAKSSRRKAVKRYAPISRSGNRPVIGKR
jgi:hypothetical protein